MSSICIPIFFPLALSRCGYLTEHLHNYLWKDCFNWSLLQVFKMPNGVKSLFLSLYSLSLTSSVSVASPCVSRTAGRCHGNRWVGLPWEQRDGMLAKEGGRVHRWVMQLRKQPWTVLSLSVVLCLGVHGVVKGQTGNKSLQVISNRLVRYVDI